MSPQTIPKAKWVNGEASKLKIKKDEIENLPELVENPFKGKKK